MPTLSDASRDSILFTRREHCELTGRGGYDCKWGAGQLGCSLQGALASTFLGGVWKLGMQRLSSGCRTAKMLAKNAWHA